MRRMWNLKPGTTKLAAAILLAASLLVAMTSTAQAGWIELHGYCILGSKQVDGFMSVSSDEYGTGYANIYRRTSSGNVLVARVTRSGRSFYMDAYEPRVAGASYFETFGFNSPLHNVSGSDPC